MIAKDYYVILGVERSESQSGIRHAFKELALRYHPDRGGPHATRFFQDIVEAYRALSDPWRRTSYDQGLEHAAETAAPPPVAPRYSPPPVAPRYSPSPEPLVPAPVGVLRDFDVREPSWEQLHDHFLRNFTAEWLPKSQRLDALTLEVAIDPEQAALGGVMVVGVPVYYPCAACRGSGRDWVYTCAACGGEGMVEEEQPVRVYVPPRTPDGTVIDLPLRGLGIHNLYLRLLLRIAW